MKNISCFIMVAVFPALMLLIPAQAQAGMPEQITLAQWTFEVSQPMALESAGVWVTNITPEFGSGTGSAFHQYSTTYSSPTGDGSHHSLSSTNWITGDCSQFACSTLGASNIVVYWEQVSSKTGPGEFQFQYSTDGMNFINFGSDYAIGASGNLSGPTAYWSSQIYNGTTAYTQNLSSVTSLNNKATVWFRLVDASTNSSSGGTAGPFGADRVDDFTVYGTVTEAPQASVIAWASLPGVPYGTPLGSNQLDATASTQGTFNYSPAAGTVLNAGTNLLTVVFTPANSSSYMSATDTVWLVVWPAPLIVAANNAARSAGQTNPPFTGTLLGVVNGDNLTASYSCSATAGSAPGIYAIVPSLNDPNGRLVNYSVTSNDGSLAVVSGATAETTLAQWSFETSQPSGTEAAGVWKTNIMAEIGNAVASAMHQDETTYTNPVGNGSTNSLSAATWEKGDFWQFAFPTLGASQISFAWDQASSYTGPGLFQFQYSTDGVNFNNFGTPYTVYENGSLADEPTNFWTVKGFNPATHYIVNLSSIPSLNNAPEVWVRLVDASTTSADGEIVYSSGANRVDNAGASGATNASSLSCVFAFNYTNITVMTCGSCTNAAYTNLVTDTCCNNVSLFFSPATNTCFDVNTTNFVSVVAQDNCTGQTITNRMKVIVQPGTNCAPCVFAFNYTNITVTTCSNCAMVSFTNLVTDTCCANVSLQFFSSTNTCFPVDDTTPVGVIASDSCNEYITNFLMVTVLPSTNCSPTCVPGESWSQTSAPSTNWRSVASSSDGTYLVAVVGGGGIYTSANSGATWTETSAPVGVAWQCVASSSDGTHLVAAVAGGGIYTSICTPMLCCVPPPTNMVLWLPFDETNGNISANLASTPNYGTQINDPIPLPGAYVANSLLFTGTNYVIVPDYTNIDIGTNDLTIDAWIYETGPAPLNPTNVIVSKEQSYGTPGYTLMLNTNRGLMFNMNSQFFTEGAVIPAQQWHFVAVDVSQRSHFGFFYVDGQVSSGFTLAPTNLYNTNSFWAGSAPFANSVPFVNGSIASWLGALDEVEVYNRALTTNELASIYNAGTAGKCKPCCYLKVLNIVPLSMGTIQVNWNDCGILEYRTNVVLGQWVPISGAASPYVITATNMATFYRLYCPETAAP